MKKIKIMPLAVLLFLCFCFAQCHKDKTPAPDNPYGLPNATQTGAGVFACRINGTNAIAKNDIYHQGGGVHNDTLGIFGSSPSGRFFNIISLGVYGNLKESVTYNFKDSIHTFCLFGTDSTCQLIVSVTNTYPKNGSFILTKLDTTHKNTTQNIISGTFSFKVPISGCDTLNVTDGRFDISY